MSVGSIAFKIPMGLQRKLDRGGWDRKLKRVLHDGHLDFLEVANLHKSINPIWIYALMIVICGIVISFWILILNIANLWKCHKYARY